MAANLFTDTGDHNWNTAANWSDGVPTSDDTVTIAAGTTSLIINANGVCASFSAAGTSGVTVSGASSLTVSGNFTLDANVTWTHTGALIINGAGEITSAGKDLSSIASLRITGAAISLTASNALNIGSKALYVNAASTTFTTNNNQIDCGTFSDNSVSGAITLALGSSTINCTALSFGSATLTVSTTGHTINISSNSATAQNFGGISWGTVNFKSNASAARAHAITFGTGASFVQFNIDQLTDRRDCSISFSGDFSVSDSCTWKSGGAGNDDPTYRLLIKSNTITSTRTVTVSAASKTLTFTDIDLQDVKVADTNSPTMALTRVGHCGGCTTADGGGYKQNVSDPKTVYSLCGATSKVDYEDIWELTRGSGVSLNNFPLPQDTGIIDNDTFSVDNRGISFYAPRRGNLDASALSEGTAHAFVFLSAGVCYGDVLMSGATVTAHSLGSDASTLTFDARVAGTLVINMPIAMSLGSYIVDSYGGTVQLAAGFSLTSAAYGNFTLTRGTLDLNGQTLTCRTLSSSNENTRELQFHGGKIIVNGLTGTIFDMSTATNLTVHDAGNIDIGDSNNTLTADVTLNFGDKTFGDVKFTKHAGDYDYIIAG